MSKTKEELNELKEEIEALNEKCCELTPEELEQVTGGAKASKVDGAIGWKVAAFGIAEPATAK